jgi:hypothetical protein
MGYRCILPPNWAPKNAGIAAVRRGEGKFERLPNQSAHALRRKTDTVPALGLCFR